MNKLVAFGILAAVVLAVGIGALLYRASTGSAYVQVSISSYSFNPNNVTVKAGTTVRWTNFDAVGHTVTFGGHDSMGTGMDSGLMGHMGTFSTTFAEPGVYEYHCDPHPSMTGVVVVPGWGGSREDEGARGHDRG